MRVPRERVKKFVNEEVIPIEPVLMREEKETEPELLTSQQDVKQLRERLIHLWCADTVRFRDGERILHRP